MTVRIIHCGKSIQNYNVCRKEKVAGFINRGQSIGETVYFAVKVEKQTLCGMRAILFQETDKKPWPDAGAYSTAYSISEIEFCKPFDLKILSEVGGKYWSLKYLQGAKPINDSTAITLLNDVFTKNKQNDFFEFNIDLTDSYEIDSDDNDLLGNESNFETIIKEVPELKLNILGTFQTINFKNETDRFSGLETLVNENFYSLFSQYPEQFSILIDENRLFKTANLANGNDITGIRGIPDGLLISFSTQQKTPFQINLIEYECYGQNKTRAQDKSNYFNGHIIPQLMRFASTFSIVTEKHIRENTINDWSDKIINYMYQNTEYENKVSNWIKILVPDTNPQLIGLKIKEYLTNAFKTNLKIVLIIDELSTEQKDTISNVIKAFKLENNDSIQFSANIVRLEQKISILNTTYEYALSIQ